MNFRFVALLALVGCTGESSVGSAEDDIALYAISGEEARASGDSTVAAVSESFEAPPPLGECDPRGTFRDTFDRFDHDGDGAIAGEESDEVEDELGPHDAEHREPREMFWHLLTVVYDTDGDGALSEAERDVLLGDFEVRCEAIGEKIESGELEPPPPPPEDGAMPEGECDGPPPMEGEFDADGDHALDDSELATLRETVRERIREGAPLLPPPPR